MAQTAPKQTTPSFGLGDNVVYPNQGAGRIIGEVERSAAGQNLVYWELELLKGSTKVLIPKGQEARVGLRLITPKKRIPELLERLNGPNLELPEGWTPRHRSELTIIGAGDIFEIAQLTGTLYRRDIERALSATERKVMDDAKQMVITEVAVALNQDLETTSAKIDGLLEQPHR